MHSIQPSQTRRDHELLEEHIDRIPGVEQHLVVDAGPSGQSFVGRLDSSARQGGTFVSESVEAASRTAPAVSDAQFGRDTSYETLPICWHQRAT